MTRSQVKYPHVHVKLTGQDGNVFNLIGLTSIAMKKAGVPDEERKAFQRELFGMSSYDAVVAKIQETVTVR